MHSSTKQTEEENMTTLINAQEVMAVLNEKNVDYSIINDEFGNAAKIIINVVLGLASRAVIFDGRPVTKKFLLCRLGALLAEQKELINNPAQCNSIEDEF